MADLTDYQGMPFAGGWFVKAKPQDGELGLAGYLIVFPGGEESWLTKDAFENAYFPLGHPPSVV